MHTLQPQFAVCKLLAAVSSNYAVPGLDQFQKYHQIMRTWQISPNYFQCITVSGSPLHLMCDLLHISLRIVKNTIVTIGSLYKCKVIKPLRIRMKGIPKRIFAMYLLQGGVCNTIYSFPFSDLTQFSGCRSTCLSKIPSWCYLATFLKYYTDTALVRSCHMVRAWAKPRHLNAKFYSDLPNYFSPAQLAEFRRIN